MPDIVANLLRLSSEAADVDDLLEPALDLALTATKAEAVAVVAPTLPDWSVLAARGVAKSAVPVELAAEALEHDDVAAADRWLAIPLVSRRGARSESIEPPYVLLVRGNAPKAQAVRGCDWIGRCAGGRRTTRTSAAAHQPTANHSRHHARMASNQRNGNAARAHGRSRHAAARGRSSEHFLVGQIDEHDRRPAGARRARWRIATTR